MTQRIKGKLTKSKILGSGKLDNPGLKFFEKSHKYKKGNKEFKSVTTFIGEMFEPFDRKGIAKKLSKFQVYKKKGLGQRKIVKQWKEAADHGTRVHKAIENYINNEPIPKTLLPDDRSKLARAREYIHHNDFKEIIAEVVVCSEKYLLAGTIDALIIKDGKLYIIDWKTNKEIKTKAYKGRKGIHPRTKDLDDCHLVKYSLQLSLYAYILEVEYGFHIEKMYITHLLKDKYVEIEAIDYRKLMEEILNETRTTKE